jgi:hypothetical protein
VKNPTEISNNYACKVIGEVQDELGEEAAIQFTDFLKRLMKKGEHETHSETKQQNPKG